MADDLVPLEDLLLARARARGLPFDAERAAALRPLVEGLLARLARLADALPREAAPDPLGPLAPGRRP